MVRLTAPPVTLPTWTRRLLLANVVAQALIVVTGGVVRLTGSGLGCTQAPECVPGSILPVASQAQGFHTYIEFGNRLLTPIVGVVALAAFLAVWRTGRARLRWLAAAPLLGVLAQAVIGAITVLTGLNPATVALHFLLSMVLLAAVTALAVRADEPDGVRIPLVRSELVWLARGLAVAGALVLTAGTVVTGSGPHAGDARNPPRFGLDVRLVSWLHADLVLIFVGLVVALLIGLRLTNAPAPVRRRGMVLLVVTLAQGLVGYTQYFTGLPIILVGVHMLGACLLVIALTRMVLGTRGVGQIRQTASTATPTNSTAR